MAHANRPSYTNTHKLNNQQLSDLTNHPHTIGVDGADYGPIREELLSILWARQNAESERAYSLFLTQQKELFKHKASAHKVACKTVNA